MNSTVHVTCWLTGRGRQQWSLSMPTITISYTGTARASVTYTFTKKNSTPVNSEVLCKYSSPTNIKWVA